jgi:hypothetical protein
MGSANVHIWLASIGQERWNLPVSLLLLCALGAWVYANRRVDVWLLLGVTAIVARLWTYHLFYDDVILVLPMVALYRIGRSEVEPRQRALAVALLALMLLGLVALYWLRHFEATAPIVWIATLVFLIYRATK